MNCTKHLLILTVVMATSLTVGQVEHAPTVAQCQADQRLWLSRIEEVDSSRQPVFRLLTEWSHEMAECEHVDPSNQLRYYNTEYEIDALESKRLLHFIVRHDLMDKFVEEDAAGKR